MPCKHIKITRKDTMIYVLYFKDDGIAKDITGWTVYFTAKEKMDDPDTSAVISKEITSHTNPTIGKTQIDLESTDTDLPVGSYYYSIDVLTDEDQEKVIISGRMTITKRVRD